MNKTARAIIIDENGLMVLYREKRKDGELINSYYALPGGHVDKGETLEECVIRELKEELNIDIEIIKYLGVLEIDGREEHYFYSKKVNGEPVLGGEELERNSMDNYYEFRYLELDNIDNYGILAIDFVKDVIKYVK